MIPINVEHPHANSDRDQGDTHTTQTVPEREQNWQNPRQLQDGGGSIKDHRAEGH